MSTRDVFTYFGEFGPSEIEWLDDSSCRGERERGERVKGKKRERETVRGGRKER